MPEQMQNVLIGERIFNIDYRAKYPQDFYEATMTGFVAAHLKTRLPSDKIGGDAECRLQFQWNGVDFFFDETARILKDINLRVAVLRIYNERDGKPYQQQLEEHVSHWRREVKEYTKDPEIALTIMGLIQRELGAFDMFAGPRSTLVQMGLSDKKKETAYQTEEPMPFTAAVPYLAIQFVEGKGWKSLIAK